MSKESERMNAYRATPEGAAKKAAYTKKQRSTPEYKEAEKKRRSTPEYKAMLAERQRRMIAKHPEKRKARQKLAYAVKTGKIIKLPCLVCGDPKSQGHHKDYNKPLEVDWLCQKHHKELEAA